MQASSRYRYLSPLVWLGDCHHIHSKKFIWGTPLASDAFHCYHYLVAPPNIGDEQTIPYLHPPVNHNVAPDTKICHYLRMEPTLENITLINRRMADLGYAKTAIGPALGVNRVTWWRWVSGTQQPERRAWRDVMERWAQLTLPGSAGGRRQRQA